MKRLFHYQLHQYPEITYKATGAATFVMVALKSSEIPFESIGGTDIVATLRRNATKEAPFLVFRTALDALAIIEKEIPTFIKGIAQSWGWRLPIFFGLLIWPSAVF
ncbi:hypothetical protein [Paenochrobactrum pullorum]|uniref:hypothetical protein n=1 Tax=Paenochrobactrum pullorum TaxID=1324351 RepID=UPI0035BC3F30